MIYYGVPYDLDKNIGVYYNRFMSMLPDDDFACFVDGDTIFTTPFYGKQIEEIVQQNRDCGLFYAVTNRIGCPWQIAEGVNQVTDNIRYHREFGTRQFEKYGHDARTVTEDYAASGFFMLVQKRIWKDVGGFKTDGMLGVDNDFHDRARRAGHVIRQMRGVYLYHWYRGGTNDILHLL